MFTLSERARFLYTTYRSRKNPLSRKVTLTADFQRNIRRAIVLIGHQRLIIHSTMNDTGSFRRGVKVFSMMFADTQRYPWNYFSNRDPRKSCEGSMRSSLQEYEPQREFLSLLFSSKMFETYFWKHHFFTQSIELWGWNCYRNQCFSVSGENTNAVPPTKILGGTKFGLIFEGAWVSDLLSNSLGLKSSFVFRISHREL